MQRYDIHDYGEGAYIAQDDNGEYVRFDDLSREKLGEIIYRSMYEHKGGMWSANETKDVWYDFADNFMKILFEAPTNAR